MHFFMENLIMKIKKDQKYFDLQEHGFEPQIFSNFPIPWFEFSWKVRVTRSNQNKLLNEIGLYNQSWQGKMSFLASKLYIVSSDLTFLTTLTLKSRPLRLPIPRKVPGMISRIKLRLKLMYSKEARACRSTSFMV